MEKAKVIIIGAGFTGVATAYDLAQRGLDVTVVDRGPIVNGTSGRTHGLLHSGARYAVKDRESATECIEENTLLRRLVPDVIEPNGGLFLAINDSDMAYREGFIESCHACGIATKELTPQQALEMEPHINPNLQTAILVPDGTFDPLRLGMAFAASAQAHGARFYLFTDVEEMILNGQGRVTGIRIWDRSNDTRRELSADVVVNATGAWAGEVAHMAGAHVPVVPTPGIMVAYDRRLVNRTINRLNAPGDGDIVLPQRRMVVVGTTSYEIKELDYVPVISEHINIMLERGCELIPEIAKAGIRGAYTATRPLIGGGTSGRSIARTFKLFDHEESEGIAGLYTITGGKATTLRLMAEKTADHVVQKLGMDIPCRTAETRLLSYRLFETSTNIP
jgi:glycerol-3-phosphate dehydrogenase